MREQKIAMVTGVNGMDGSIISDKLLSKGYKVIGIDRWCPTGISPNLKETIKNKDFIIESGDICERDFISRLIKKYEPDYFYNLAAISLVPESFKIPLTIFETNTMSVINMLECIREYSPNTRFYQASTSEQIGDNTDFPQNTDSMMLPNSPYAISKLASYHMVRMYRNSFGLFACNGMLWNHEGIRRGPTFVTRKITTSVSNQIKKKNVQPIQIGNLDTHRDWGNADEYCNAMILIMESDKPDDYAVNTGESHTIREFIEETYKYVNIKIIWKGIGMEEKGYDENNNLLVEVNPYYYRNTDVLYLHGDYSKIKNALGWEPKTKFKELVQIMMRHDLDE